MPRLAIKKFFEFFDGSPRQGVNLRHRCDGDLIEVRLKPKKKTTASLACLKAVLENVGVLAQEIVETPTEIKIFLPTGQSSREFICQLRHLSLRGVLIRYRRLPAQNWQNHWKKAIKPFLLTRHIMVVPTWSREKPLPKGKQVIYLDNNLSFGTGLHETTQRMSRLIEEHAGKFSSFFDVGTGTGILSIVAYLCGAKEILALDADPLSVGVARKNFKLNRVRAARVVHRNFKEYRLAKKFDYVAANLFTEDLICFRRKLLSYAAPGGLLAISGISLPNLKHLLKEFRQSPLRCLKVCRGRQWAAVLYQNGRRSRCGQSICKNVSSI